MYLWDTALSLTNFVSGCSLSTVALLIVVFVVARKLLWNHFKVYVIAQIYPGIRLSEFGRWAVITGSTDGLGKEYARKLASLGLDIVLIARTSSKLEAVKSELIQDYQCKVITIQADFKLSDIYDRIRETIANLDIAILVNNVGATQELSDFHDIQHVRDLAAELWRVNCLSAVGMCSTVLPGMREKNKGVIVNITSCLAYNGNPSISLYSACKSYAAMLSKCMQQAYTSNTGGDGILIQTLRPGMIKTKMLPAFFPKEPSAAELSLKNSMSVTAESFVSYAYRTIGWTGDCMGHPLHEFLDVVLKLIT